MTWLRTWMVSEFEGQGFEIGDTYVGSERRDVVQRVEKEQRNW